MQALLIFTSHYDKKKNCDSIMYNTPGRNYFPSSQFTTAKPGLALMDFIDIDKGTYAFVNGHMFTPKVFDVKELYEAIKSYNSEHGITDISGSFLYCIETDKPNIAYINVCNNAEQDSYIIYKNEDDEITFSSAGVYDRESLRSLAVSATPIEYLFNYIKVDEARELSEDEMLLLSSRLPDITAYVIDKKWVVKGNVVYFIVNNKYYTVMYPNFRQTHDGQTWVISYQDTEEFRLSHYLGVSNGKGTPYKHVSRYVNTIYGNVVTVDYFDIMETTMEDLNSDTFEHVKNTFTEMENFRNYALKKLGTAAVKDAKYLMPKYILGM